MDSDDRQFGRILSRREALSLLGAGGVAFLAACSDKKSPAAPATSSTSAPARADVAPTAAGSAAVQAPSCIVRPALTEGPYFVDEKLTRSDIRSDPADGSVR